MNFRSVFSLKSLVNLVISVLLVALGGVVGFQLGQGKNIPLLSKAVKVAAPKAELVNILQPEDRSEVDFQQFWNVWNVLEQNYLDEEKLNSQEMVHGAIAGMTAALDDPYTVYLPPQEQQRSTEDLQGSFYGVGIQLGYIKKTLAVIAPLKDTPADKAGIKAGDLIIHLKDDTKDLDEDTVDMSLPEAVNKIRGKKGVPITLTLFRPDDKIHKEPFDVDIKRGEIVVPSVELEFIEYDGKKVAHLQLFRFGERTNGEWDKAVLDISLEPNLDGVVLDMRNNPGGFLDGSIDIASEFVSGGTVVSQQGKFTTRKYPTTRQGRLTKIPVVVLINKGSASASEIVAGALRDRRKAKLVGENSFGKGTVQDALQLENGGGLHVTIGRWLLPKGGWIHEKGLEVDVEVKDDPETEENEVLLKAIEVL